MALRNSRAPTDEELSPIRSLSKWGLFHWSITHEQGYTLEGRNAYGEPMHENIRLPVFEWRPLTAKDMELL